jgi:hypothetical protein
MPVPHKEVQRTLDLIGGPFSLVGGAIGVGMHGETGLEQGIQLGNIFDVTSGDKDAISSILNRAWIAEEVRRSSKRQQQQVQRVDRSAGEFTEDRVAHLVSYLVGAVVRNRCATSSTARPLALLCNRWSASSGETRANSPSVSLLALDTCATAGDERRSQVKTGMARTPYLPSRNIMARSVGSRTPEELHNHVR